MVFLKDQLNMNSGVYKHFYYALREEITNGHCFPSVAHT